MPKPNNLPASHPGSQLSFGHWLHPIVDANDPGPSTSNLVETVDTAHPEPVRRGKGRPRLTHVRDESAVEKRRAQVREAQRTYQKRKDNATATERRRCDGILQVMSDLSMDVEALLQAALRANAMNNDGEIAANIRRLWLSYDAAINSPCVSPELRLLQTKNDRRKAELLHTERSEMSEAPVVHPLVPQGPECVIRRETDRSVQMIGPGDSSPRSDAHFSRQGTTLITPFSHVQSEYPPFGSRPIFDAVKEGQAEFHRR